VAVGLTTVMLWGLLQLYTSATRFSSTVTIEAELCSAGRAVLERMARETASATVRETGHTLVINNGGDFDTLSFWAPVGDDGEVVQVAYGTTDVNGKQALVRTVAGNPAQLGLNVERFNITHIKTDGTSGGPYSSSDELPLAVQFEILTRDTKGRAVIALSSSAFLPGGGF
jgi:hypothetical protein